VHPFAALDTDPLLLPSLTRRHITTPTAVQTGTLAAAHAGRDVVAVAPTGSGKTLAFLLPIARRLRNETPPKDRQGKVDPMHRLRAVVLAPTRELAQQIAREAEWLFGGTVLRVACAYGKSAIAPQVAALRRGTDLLVATPGRLRELLEVDACSLAWLRMLVIDEADRMLDMGFLPQVKAIADRCPTERQTLLYTATLPKPVEELARELVREPLRFGERLTEARTEPVAFDAADALKTPLLLHLLQQTSRTGVLVFVRTRRRAGWVQQALHRHGIAVGSLHGDRSQKQREAALEGVAAGRLRVLVATDVAARGLHVPALRCVVNYDLPMVDQDLVHRLGRAGHGHAGFAEAFAFVDPDEGARWKRLAKACDFDARLQAAPASVQPRERATRGKTTRPQPATAQDRRQSAKADRKARRERVEKLRRQRDDMAATRGRLRGKSAGKPLDASVRPGKGVRK
jgi:ATP-dependent RNA helicase RhlE